MWAPKFDEYEMFDEFQLKQQQKRANQEGFACGGEVGSTRGDGYKSK